MLSLTLMLAVGIVSAYAMGWIFSQDALFDMLVIRIVDNFEPTRIRIPFSTKSRAPFDVGVVSIFDPAHNIETPTVLTGADGNIKVRLQNSATLERACGGLARFQALSERHCVPVLAFVRPRHWESALQPMNPAADFCDFRVRSSDICDVELPTHWITAQERRIWHARSDGNSPGNDVSDNQLGPELQNQRPIRYFRLLIDRNPLFPSKAAIDNPDDKQTDRNEIRIEGFICGALIFVTSFLLGIEEYGARRGPSSARPESLPVGRLALAAQA